MGSKQDRIFMALDKGEINEADARGMLGMLKQGPKIDKVIDERHDDISFKDRAVFKNFSTDVGQGVSYLQQQYPDHEIKDSKKGVIIRKKGANSWKKLDPSGFELEDITDSAYDIAGGIAEGAASIAAGVAGGIGSFGVGALPAAALAGAGTGAAVEGLRQGIGSMIGVSEGADFGRVGTSAAFGAASPLLFGTGAGLKQLGKNRLQEAVTGAAEKALQQPANAGLKSLSKEALEEATNKGASDLIKQQSGAFGRSFRFGKESLAARAGALVSGDSKENILYASRNLDLIKEAEDAGGAAAIFKDVSDKMQGAQASSQKSATEEFGGALEALNFNVSTDQVEGPLQKMLQTKRAEVIGITRPIHQKNIIKELNVANSQVRAMAQQNNPKLDLLKSVSTGPTPKLETSLKNELDIADKAADVVMARRNKIADLREMTIKKGSPQLEIFKLREADFKRALYAKAKATAGKKFEKAQNKLNKTIQDKLIASGKVDLHSQADNAAASKFYADAYARAKQATKREVGTTNAGIEHESIKKTMAQYSGQGRVLNGQEALRYQQNINNITKIRTDDKIIGQTNFDTDLRRAATEVAVNMDNVINGSGIEGSRFARAKTNYGDVIDRGKKIDSFFGNDEKTEATIRAMRSPNKGSVRANLLKISEDLGGGVAEHSRKAAALAKYSNASADLVSMGGATSTSKTIPAAAIGASAGYAAGYLGGGYLGGVLGAGVGTFMGSKLGSPAALRKYMEMNHLLNKGGSKLIKASDTASGKYVRLPQLNQRVWSNILADKEGRKKKRKSRKKKR